MDNPGLKYSFKSGVSTNVNCFYEGIAVSGRTFTGTFCGSNN